MIEKWEYLRDAYESYTGWVSLGPDSFQARNRIDRWVCGGDWNSPAGSVAANQHRTARPSESSQAINLQDLPSAGKYDDRYGGARLGSPGRPPAAGGPPERRPPSSHDFEPLGGPREGGAAGQTETVEETVEVRMRGPGGEALEGRVRVLLPARAAEAWSSLARQGSAVRSLCTVIAGREAARVRLPAAAAGGGVAVLVVVSERQWAAGADVYARALEGPGGEWRGVAVAQDSLLPERCDVAHRRLLSLRLAMGMRAACAGGPGPALLWEQWVQADDNVLRVVDRDGRPMGLSEMLEAIGGFVDRYPAVVVAEQDHRFERGRYVDAEVRRTGSGKLTAVAWGVLNMVEERFGPGSLDLLFPCAPRLEDFFQLMLAQLVPQDGARADGAARAGGAACRPRRYFGLVRCRADPGRALAAARGWTPDQMAGPESLRSRGVAGEELRLRQLVVLGEGVRDLIVEYGRRLRGSAPQERGAGRSGAAGGGPRPAAGLGKRTRGAAAAESEGGGGSDSEGGGVAGADGDVGAPGAGRPPGPHGPPAARRPRVAQDAVLGAETGSPSRSRSGESSGARADETGPAGTPPAVGAGGESGGFLTFLRLRREARQQEEARLRGAAEAGRRRQQEGRRRADEKRRGQEEARRQRDAENRLREQWAQDLVLQLLQELRAQLEARKRRGATG